MFSTIFLSVHTQNISYRTIIKILNKIILIAIFSKPLSVFGLDVDNRIFNHLTSTNGLSNNDIQRVLQTSNGDLWIGTVNGLNKYDGYQFTIYTPNPNNANTISNKFAFELIEDHEGNLWIGTLNGLNKFNTTTEIFSHFFMEKNNNSISSNMIRTLLADKNYLWIGTSAGFDVMDLHTNKIKNIISDRIITDMVDDGNHIWLASLYNDLIKYHKKTGEILTFKLPYRPRIRALVKDRHIIWIATDIGVIAFDTITQLINSNNYLLPDKMVQTLAIDSDNNLWIGTHLQGLYVYSIKTGNHKKVFSDSNDVFFLPGNSINNLTIDSNNILWVGGTTFLSYSSLNKPVNILRVNNAKLVSNGVGRISAGSNGELWMASSDGVNRYIDGTNHIYPIGSIYDILINQIDIIALGESGLYHYNHLTNNFDNYNKYLNQAYLEQTSKSKRNLRFTDIIYLGDNKYLLGTYGGVVLWNIETHKSQLIRITDTSGTERYKNIIYLLYKYQDEILVGTPNGLFVYDEKNNMLTPYNIKDNSTVIAQSEIFHITTDKNQFLWIATNNGLLKIKKNFTINHYTINDGLLDNSTNSIFISDDILWVGTDKGLSAFTINDDQFNRIHLNSSHFDKSFSHKSAYIDKQGLLYFGTNQGLLYFNQEHFISQSPLPRTKITNFRLFNQIIPAGSALLSHNISVNKHLILNHKQNMLSLEFSSFNIMQPKHLYAYQLQGFTEDQHWIITDADNRQATFTPTPGEYTFRVKSGWDTDNWSNEITELKVTILPPWWKSIWAFILYVIGLLAIIIAIYLIRTRHIRLQAENLEKQVIDRTAKIQTQKIKIEQQSLELADLIKKKEQIFTNISHEFRTPLTLIISPLKQILHIASEAQKSSILLVQCNAYRLLRLVNQLLELSQLRSQLRASHTSHALTTEHNAGSQKKDLGNNHELNHNDQNTVSVQRLINAILPSFTQLADSKKIKLFADIDNIVTQCSYDELEKIITNLLSNAIKYTLAEGSIHLTVKKIDSQYCCIKIIDNGIGIPQDQLENIFEPFVRLKSYPNIEGSGIGLSLVKELVNACNGSIDVNSILNHGTTLSIKLPIAPFEKRFPQASIDSYSENMQIDHMNLEIMDLSGKIREDLIVDQSSYCQMGTHNSSINFYSENEKPLLLIIEDNPDMNRYLQMLCSDHFHCLSANNGIQGVKLAQQYIPDIIISDIMMPGIDGYSVVTELKEDICTSHIPIILLSALNDRDHRLKGLIKKADEYMTKPFDSDELLIRLDNLLSIRQLVKKYFFQQCSTHANKQITDSSWTQFSNMDKIFISQFREVIEGCYQDESLSQEMISEKLSMSCRQVQRKLRSLIDLSPVEFLRAFRIDKSVDLLKQGHQIEHIAYEVGFSSRNYFSSCFKAKMGITPKQYQTNLARQRSKISV